MITYEAIDADADAEMPRCCFGRWGDTNFELVFDLLPSCARSPLPNSIKSNQCKTPATLHRCDLVHTYDVSQWTAHKMPLWSQLCQYCHAIRTPLNSASCSGISISDRQPSINLLALPIVDFLVCVFSPFCHSDLSLNKWRLISKFATSNFA